MSLSNCTTQKELAINKKKETPCNRSQIEKKNFKLRLYLKLNQRFEKLEINCRHDYDSLQSSFKHGNPPPRYHYENRTFHNVRSNTDLGDQDCELRIVKCINISLPSGYNKDDMKVYVSYEFPFPNDQPQTGFTETIKHNINPVAMGTGEEYFYKRQNGRFTSVLETSIISNVVVVSFLIC
ncbi:coiled-coil and C2 domain-containing protein 1B-like [Xenia sp. Carnegie-2017]|uniref:coiled-coil and C2 domain-containing protein 1B-like n=1 Tax=Xenia sp. Carnegie-2017 TaxID=2897299 RepID=UPI001F03B00C|nr:coiled-coil and C2 domain-containing protein 1B-like [Xenia sp. Carnegie-2017]